MPDHDFEPLAGLQPARHASRRSPSRTASSPASDDSEPPSIRAVIAFPFTGERPGCGGVMSIIWRVSAFRSGVFSLNNRNLRWIRGLGYIHQPSSIFRARNALHSTAFHLLHTSTSRAMLARPCQTLERVVTILARDTILGHPSLRS